MGKTILIVEDEQSIVDILSFNLTKEGYDTLEALDGPTGLQLALEQNPDLVLLDLMLPGMNGFDVCKAVREKNTSIRPGAPSPLSCSPPGRRRTTRSRVWSWGRTTISQSPSRIGSCWPGLRPTSAVSP